MSLCFFRAFRSALQMYFGAAEAAVSERKMLTTDVNDSRQCWTTTGTEQLKAWSCSKRSEERPGELTSANGAIFLRKYSV